MNKKTECSSIRGMLSSYIDHELSRQEEERVKAHLVLCKECREEYDQLVSLVEGLGEVEQVSIPQEFEVRWKQALAAERQGSEIKNLHSVVSKKEPKVKKHTWRMLASIAAVFAVCLITFLVHDDIQILPEALLHPGDDQTLNQQIVSDASDDPDTAKEDSMSDGDKNKNSNQGKDGIAVQGKPEKPANSSQPQITKKESDPPNVKSDQDAKAAPKGTSDENSGTDGGQEESDAQQPALMSALPNLSDDTNNPGNYFRSAGPSPFDEQLKAYQELIDKKLKDYEYEIKSYEQKKNGEWDFTVFILRKKDGKMIKKEIEVIGKDGVLQFPEDWK